MQKQQNLEERKKQVRPYQNPAVVVVVALLFKLVSRCRKNVPVSAIVSECPNVLRPLLSMVTAA